MEKKIKKTEKFSHSILRLDIERSKALANTVMGLASQTNARSVTELSLSRCYHFQYSSISKVTDEIYRSKGKDKIIEASDRLKVEKKFIC